MYMNVSRESQKRFATIYVEEQPPVFLFIMRLNDSPRPCAAWFSAMGLLTQAGLVLGLLLLLGLLLWQGAQEVLALLLSSGWPLLLLPLVWCPTLLPATQGWRQLFQPGHVPPFSRALAALWMGRAVNNLLPVASLGGEVVKARLLFLWGASGKRAAASVMVDKAAQALALACWGLLGVLLLLRRPGNEEFAFYAAAGFAVLVAGVFGFIVAQRAGLVGGMARAGQKLTGKMMNSDAWEGMRVSASEVDEIVRVLYAEPKKILLATGWRLLGLMLHTAELWLACWLLGHPIGLLDALLLRSLTAALSDIAFFIPNAYGAQEGAFIVVGALLGLSPELALALSLALRLRDLAFDPAGLLALHHIESRRYFARR